MAVAWAASADKHGIPHDEALWAIANAVLVMSQFGEPRLVGGARPTLFIGPSRFGTLEVLVTITPPRDLFVFHVMRLRESTARAAGYRGRENRDG